MYFKSASHCLQNLVQFSTKITAIQYIFRNNQGGNVLYMFSWVIIFPYGYGTCRCRKPTVLGRLSDSPLGLPTLPELLWYNTRAWTFSLICSLSSDGNILWILRESMETSYHNFLVSLRCRNYSSGSLWESLEETPRMMRTRPFPCWACLSKHPSEHAITVIQPTPSPSPRPH